MTLTDVIEQLVATGFGWIGGAVTVLFIQEQRRRQWGGK